MAELEALNQLIMTHTEIFAQLEANASGPTGPAFLRRLLQVVAVGSWLPLAYFGLSMLGYRSADGPLEAIGGGLLLAIPWLTLFACLSFFLDRRSTSWWVWPSNLAFLVLSIGPSVLFGYLQLLALAQLTGTPMPVD